MKVYFFMVSNMSDYEKKIVRILNKDGLSFSREKTFIDLRKGKFRYDFYVLDVCGGPALVEMDGQFHFKPIHGRAALLHQQENDRRKNSYALANSIPLYRIPFWELENIHSAADIFQDKFLVRSKWHNDEIWRQWTSK